MDGEHVETVTDFILLGSKITADGACSHEIKKRLLLGRKAITNLNHILKSRNIALPTKVQIVKAMVFPAIYGCESWTIKKVEHWRTDAFELWCWRGLLSVLRQQGDPTSQSERKSTLNIGRTDTEAEAPILWPPDVKKPTHWKRPWCWERLKRGGNKGWDCWMESSTQRTWVWANSRR